MFLQEESLTGSLLNLFMVKIKANASLQMYHGRDGPKKGRAAGSRLERIFFQPVVYLQKIGQKLGSGH